ncbi:MAG: hypothetical protein UIG52_06635 [Bacteroidales bacterium]|nr:hypothetical protein [Bacteroidales bacterium]
MTEKEIYLQAKERGATFVMAWCYDADGSTIKTIVMLDDIDNIVYSPTEFKEVEEKEIPPKLLDELKLGHCNRFFLSVNGSGVAYEKAPALSDRGYGEKI